MSIFTRFTRRSLAANRTRTVVSAIGIALSCALICAVLTSVVSMTHMLAERTMADEGAWQVEAVIPTSEGLERIAADDRVASHMEVTELGTVSLGEENASDYGRWLFVKTWPVNPEGARIVAEPEITAGRAPEAPGEIMLPHYLEGAALAPSGLGSTGPLEIGSEVTLEMGTRTVTDLSTGLSQTGTSLYGSYVDEATTAESFEQNLGTVSGTVVGFYRAYGFSSTRALSGNTVYLYPEAGDAAAAAADASDATVAYSLITVHRAQDAGKLADDLAPASAPGGVATHTSLLRWQGVTGTADVWNTLYAIAAILAAVIAVAGISLVYNSFAISVAERTRQFGLLASLGASKRQLRRTVLVEALLLGAVGIPAGLLLGIAGCYAVFKLTGTGLAAMFDADAYGIAVQVVVSPAALAISAAVALLTVLISAWVPALRASRVSAVDAIRQTQDVRLSRRAARAMRRRARKAEREGGPVDARYRGLAARVCGVPGFIAHRNLTRNTSKGRVTVAALAVSVALLIISGVVGNVLGYASGTALNTYDAVDLQVSVDATASEGARGTVVREDGRVDAGALQSALDRLYDEVGQVAGAEPLGCFSSYVADVIVPAEMVSDGASQFFGTLLADGRWSGPIYVDYVDDASWRSYIQELGLAEDEYCDPENPVAVALNQYDYNSAGEYSSYSPLSAGGTVQTVTFAHVDGMYTGGIVSRDGGEASVWYNAPDGSEKYLSLEEGIEASDEIKVGALADHAPAGINTHTSTMTLVLPASAVSHTATMGFASAYVNLSTDGSAEKAAKAQEAVEAIAAGYAELDCTFSNYAQSKAQTRMMSDTVQTFIYCFTVICGLIAVANVFNTLTNSLMLRRREFAVLKSVGMGNRAFRRMIAYECASFAVRGFLIGLALACAVELLLTQAMRQSFTTYAFELPLLQVALAAALVLGVIVISVAYALKRSRAASIVDALREDAI